MRCVGAMRTATVACLLAVVGAMLAVQAGASEPSGSGDPSTDKLAQVLSRGTLVMSTDPAYAPQSYRVKGAKRLAQTKCAENQFTANQMAGYDADTSKLVARGLGVEP